MALIDCPKCGKKVSDKANKCVHCGFPLLDMTSDTTDKKVSVFEYSDEAPQRNNMFRLLFIFGIIAAIGIGCWIWWTISENKKEAEMAAIARQTQINDSIAQVKAEQAAEEARRQRELEEESQVVPSIEALLKFLKKPGQNHIFEDISGLYVSYLTKYDEYHESEGYGDDGSVHHTIYGHNVSIDQTNPIRLSADDERAFYIDVVHSYYDLSAKFFFKRKSDYKKFVKRIKSSDKFKRKGEFIDGFYECFNEFIVDFGQKSTIAKGWYGVGFCIPLEE